MGGTSTRREGARRRADTPVVVDSTYDVLAAWPAASGRFGLGRHEKFRGAKRGCQMHADAKTSLDSLSTRCVDCSRQVCQQAGRAGSAAESDAGVEAESESKSADRAAR